MNTDRSISLTVGRKKISRRAQNEIRLIELQVKVGQSSIPRVVKLIMTLHLTCLGDLSIPVNFLWSPTKRRPASGLIVVWRKLMAFL
ncbi:unnamed protein product [Trifolium pratense]|uniref:Uncharacterized protein n=1 Tax=Trifolium pratense TaxID=57577 RepID=A0ACB0J820_TRIPR|nr:unnamed protein product [Trifolium pratense]